MLNRKKYLVRGGHVSSQHDGHFHYIPAQRVMELYHLNPRQCYLLDEQDDHSRLVGVNVASLILVGPRFDGHYRICPICTRPMPPAHSPNDRHCRPCGVELSFLSSKL